MIRYIVFLTAFIILWVDFLYYCLNRYMPKMHDKKRWNLLFKVLFWYALAWVIVCIILPSLLLLIYLLIHPNSCQ